MFCNTMPVVKLSACFREARRSFLPFIICCLLGFIGPYWPLIASGYNAALTFQGIVWACSLAFFNSSIATHTSLCLSAKWGWSCAIGECLVIFSIDYQSFSIAISLFAIGFDFYVVSFANRLIFLADQVTDCFRPPATVPGSWLTARRTTTMVVNE